MNPKESVLTILKKDTSRVLKKQIHYFLFLLEPLDLKDEYIL